MVQPELLNAWIPNFQKEPFDYSPCTECTHTHREMWIAPVAKAFQLKEKDSSPKQRLALHHKYSPLSSPGDKEKAAAIAQELLSDK